jgi:competence protein ComEC
MEPILAAARGLAAGGGESLYLHHMPGWPAMSLGLLAAALLVVPFNPRLKFASAVLWLPLLLPPERPLNLEKDVLEVVVLDVGQGTAIVIASGSRVLLYDTGGGDPLGANMARTVVLPYLRSRGVRQLDSFIVSHADRDHSAGAATVLASLEVGRVRYGGDQPWLDRGLPCRAGEAWRWHGGPRFQILAPAQESDLGRNDSSCVLRVEFFGYVLLISGDIESRRERELVRYWGDHLQSEWLHVAHHGSRTSSSPVWLKHLDPGRAVISSGHANPFGHPHAEVVLRLESVGAEVEHTARSGALIFRFTPGETLVVDHFRSVKRRFWM